MAAGVGRSMREILVESGSNPDEVVSAPFTLLELHEAFERVENPATWKGPINTVVTVRDGRELEAILRAVPFFTGGPATARAFGRNAYRVKAAGYYRTVGA